MRRAALSVMVALACAGCSHSPTAALLSKYADANSITSFLMCSNYGCNQKKWVSVTADEWAQVRALFSVRAQNANQERDQIRHAIALMETITGPKAGTQNDRPGAVIITFARKGQMDCIDEAYNTSTYLTFLADENLLAWHDVGMPAKRGNVVDRWFHNTATIIERASGASYTVDSWFGANGAMPDVVPLQAWMEGWSPAKQG